MDYNQADLRLQAYKAAREASPTTEGAIEDAKKILEFVTPPKPPTYTEVNYDGIQGIVEHAFYEHRRLSRPRSDGSGVTALIIGTSVGLALLAIGYLVFAAVA